MNLMDMGSFLSKVQQVLQVGCWMIGLGGGGGGQGRFSPPQVWKKKGEKEKGGKGGPPVWAPD